MQDAVTIMKQAGLGMVGLANRLTGPRTLVLTKAEVDKAFRLDDFGYYGNGGAFARIDAAMPISDDTDAMIPFQNLISDEMDYQQMNALLGLSRREIVDRCVFQFEKDGTRKYPEGAALDQAYEALKAIGLAQIYRGSRFFRSAAGLSGVPEHDQTVLVRPQVNFARYTQTSDDSTKFAVAIVDGFTSLPVSQLPADQALARINADIAQGFPWQNKCPGYRVKGPVRFAMKGTTQDWESPESGHPSLVVDRIIVDGHDIRLTRDNVTVALKYAQILTTQIFAGEHYDPAQAFSAALMKTQVGLKVRGLGYMTWLSPTAHQ